MFGGLPPTSRAHSAPPPQLLDEELTQFGSQKEAILQDMTEAVLGRLTSPSALILKQLSSDPQVR